MTGWFTNYEDDTDRQEADKKKQEEFDWKNHKEVLEWDKKMLQYIFDKELLREYRATLKNGQWVTDRHWQEWRLHKIKQVFGITESLFSHMQRDMANQMLNKEAQMFTKEKEKLK